MIELFISPHLRLGAWFVRVEMSILNTAIIIVFIIVVLNIKTIERSWRKSDTRNIKINTKERCVLIGNSSCRFSDINTISVKEDIEQNSIAERYFTRYGHNNCFTEISFNLKNGTCIKYNAITKNQVYKILKAMQPYVILKDDPEYFKTPFCDGPTLFGLICFIIYMIFSWHSK